MASWAHSIQRIRRERLKEAPPPPTELREHESAYRDLLKEIRILGGDAAIDELTDWIVDHTHETGRVPHPDEVRRWARTICEKCLVEIPSASPLQSPD